jgi:serine/threonine-protein kinase
MSVATLAGGRYRIERVLGGGGMAVVYRAHDEELHRTVAVKLLAEHLAEDPEFRQRFLGEARAAARLSHPNVVAVYDAGEDEGRPFIVMEVVEGETLADVLARRRPLPPSEVVALGIQAAAGLEHAHAHGLVHRDVKPQNLLLRADGVLKVADFGIARAAVAATRRLTRAGTILGTAAYLAPEQAAGEDVTAAADVYALGAVLYEAASGRPPFRGETPAELLAARQESVVVPLSERARGVPPALEELVMRCLARNPDYRPASAGELARLLEALSDASTEPLPAAAPVRRGGRDADVHLHRTVRKDRGDVDVHHHHRGRWWLAGLAAVAVVAAVVLALMLVPRGSSRPAAPPPDRPNHPARQAGDLADWLRAVAG